MVEEGDVTEPVWLKCVTLAWGPAQGNVLRKGT